MIRIPVSWFLAAFLLLGQVSLAAQEGDPGVPPIPGESLRVSLITIGQGDVVWERFGHNAILIQDEATGWEMSYHWGVFSFEQVDFIPRLIKGTMLYSMGLADPGIAVLEYRRAGRPVWVQELNLTPSQRLELLERVEENYLPENRDYRYDYYRDNCSTRVRDHLDQVLGGVIEARFASDTTAHDYRWHTRAVLKELPAYYLGIQFVLGPNADHPITVWEEMFLPLTLRDRLREIQVSDGEGGVRRLVREERVLNGPEGPERPAFPPFALPMFFLAGLLWGGGLLGLARTGPGHVLARRMGFTLLAGSWVLLAGLSGTLLLAAWLFTDHFFWYANFNLFQVNPIFLFALPPLAVFLFRGRFPTWGKKLVTVLVTASVVGLLLELLPWIGQRNAEILAFTLPMNLALWVGVARLPDRVRGKPGTSVEKSG